MKKNFYITLLISCFYSALSLAQTNISGIINTYTAVSNITSTCLTCSNPSCYTDITVASTAGFTVGGRALLIQMQGAVIDESNSASFGNITNNNNTGNFEYVNIISFPNATTVRVRPITQTYSTSSSVPRGVTQLITVPYYVGNVTVSGTLTAAAWNGTTGGVLVFIATGKVFLNANIDVNGRGFRGYAHHESSNGDCLEQDYYMSSATEPNQGALKGEGVALVIANKERGRGKQATGGGGGDGHNGGGGGGGNGGFGGLGGMMYMGCPNLWGRGEGGLMFVASSTRVVMGGAGGTGDSNGTGAADPGGDATNGGGIILIQADSIVNTTHSLGYTGPAGPPTQAGGYFASTYTHMQEFDALCTLTLTSVNVNAQTAQTVTIRLLAPDKTTVLQTVSVAVPAGVSAVPVGFTIPPARGYFLQASGTGNLYFVGNTGTFPLTVPDIISVVRTEPNPNNNNIPYMYNWVISSPCASNGYKIMASGIDVPNVVDSDGGGGGGAGGSIYIKANGYRGRINMIAKGGEGSDMVGGGCHAPGAGGGGGYICLSTVPLTNVHRNVTGAAPGEIPDLTSSCWTPVTGYNSHGATKGGDGITCNNLLVASPCTLPVDLISFTGWKVNETTQLEWITSKEENNEQFILERSGNGTDFTAIATIPGSGNSDINIRYSYQDKQPLNGMNYYRFKQIDFDGTISYSNVIGILHVNAELEIYPNPNDGTFKINLIATSQSYTLEITDVNGRMVYSKSGDIAPESVELNNLSDGVYFVRFNVGNDVVVKKLIVY